MIKKRLRDVTSRLSILRGFTACLLLLLTTSGFGQEGGTPYDRGKKIGEDSTSAIARRAEWMRSRQSGDGESEINPVAQVFSELSKLEAIDRRDVHTLFPWKPLGPHFFRTGALPSNNTGGLGRVNCLAFDPKDPDTLYAGSAAGGLWKSTNGATSWDWIAKFDPRLLSISGIAIDPGDPNTLYVLTGDGNASITIAPSLPSVGVLKSTDAGESWQITGLDWSTDTERYGFKLEIDPKNRNVLFAVANDGIYRTEDKAATWQRVLADATRDVALHPEDSRIAYAATTEKTYFSTDHGKTWSEAEFEPTWGTSENANLRRIALAVTPDAPDRVYAVVGELSGFVGLYRSEDRGRSYSLISNAPNILGYSYYGGDAYSVSYYALAIAVSPANAEEVWVAGVNVWKSGNGGYTWTIRGYYDNLEPYPYIHADTHGLYFRKARRGSAICKPSKIPSEYHLFNANDAGVYKTEDAGFSWCNVSKGLRITQVYRLCGLPGESDVYYGAQDNGSNGLRIGTASVVFRGDGAECVIDYNDSNTVYVSQSNGIIVRHLRNTGAIISVTPPIADSSGAFITPFILHPNEPKTLFACYEDLWKSADGGVRWTNLSQGAMGTDTCLQTAVSRADPKVVYVAKKKSVYASPDDGVSWSEKTGELPVDTQSLTNLAVSRRDAQRAAVTFGGYKDGLKIFETHDGGRTWENISGSLPNLPANVALYHDGAEEERAGLYVGTDLGIFFRRDGCSQGECRWLRMLGLPPFIVTDIEIHGDLLRAATFGQGVWETKLIPTTPNLPIRSSTKGF